MIYRLYIVDATTQKRHSVGATTQKRQIMFSEYRNGVDFMMRMAYTTTNRMTGSIFRYHRIIMSYNNDRIIMSYNRYFSIDRPDVSNEYNQTVINDFIDKLYRDLQCNVTEKTDRLRYNNKIYDLLNKYKNTRDLSENDLKKLQIDIENQCMNFNESNIFSETPNLVKLMIGKDLICAKDYLYQNLPEDIYNSTISNFGQYTLEAIIIHVLGLLYNCIKELSIVRVSTLMDTLEREVRTQANIIKKNQLDNSRSTSSLVSSSQKGEKKERRVFFHFLP